ncbi:inhibin beta C chain-like [Ambystoma mexicanum]|uniref:inhibin beta C chain-like n=1 Tax=Ambystoma mexicanum TaxID=8296 RepID=UPI0037E8512B
MSLSWTPQGAMGWQCQGAWLCLLLLVAISSARSVANPGEEVDGPEESGKERKPGCPLCGVLPTLAPEEEWRILTELAKQQILSKLHLKERPNITHPVPRVTVANALRRLHPSKSRLDGLLGPSTGDNQVDGQDEQGYEIISFAESDFSNSTNARLTFHFTSDRAQDVLVLHAHLWLYFKSQRGSSSNVTARLYLSRPGQADRILVSERQLEVTWGGWHTFPLTSALQDFFNRGDKVLQLELECEGGRSLVLNSSEAHQPFMVAQAKVRDAEHRMAKRSLNCDKNSKLCCRKDYYVDFKDIGWNDWIIKPDGYQINYCMGLCPLHIAGAPGMAASFHTTVLNLIKANNINTSTSSCCVPTKHRALSMLYYDKNLNIVQMNIPNMIVEACGCS